MLLSVTYGAQIGCGGCLVTVSSLVIRRPSATLSVLRTFPAGDLRARTSDTCCNLLVARTESGGCVVRAGSSLVRSTLACCGNAGSVRGQTETRCCSNYICQSSREEARSVARCLVTGPLTRGTKREHLLDLVCLGVNCLCCSRGLGARTSSDCRLTRRVNVRLGSSILRTRILSQQKLVYVRGKRRFCPRTREVVLRTLNVTRGLSGVRLEKRVFSTLNLLCG